MSHNAKFMAEFIATDLVGWKITEAFVDHENDGFGFTVSRDKKRIWIDCDAEGNGPGWLNEEPIEGEE
jgi:hypothetical protein